MDKYTVIIPTRDRCDTLGPTIKTCLDQTYDNFEIIVCDNFSSDQTPEVVKAHVDPRLKYFRTSKRLSMADNFEFALSKVDEGFVMFIGDDDGLLKDSINYVASLQTTSGMLAISGSNAEYCWPNFPDPIRANSLKWTTSCNSSEIRRTKEWRERCLKFRDIYTFEMPKLYHGFVHKQIIDKACHSNRFFHSITPDAYSAFAVSFFVDEYLYSHRPFTIGGASGRSNGVSALDGNGKSDEVEKFLAENSAEFHPSLIFCPSLEINMAEAFLQFANLFPDRTAGLLPDWEVMLRSALDSANPRTFSEVRNAVQEMAFSFKIDLRKPCLRYREAQTLRKWDGLRRVLSARMRGGRLKDSSIYGVQDVHKASHLISESIEKANRKNALKA